ncbi:MAG: hypothetical protein WA975_06585 [Mesorhizobium sp.]
MSRQNYRVTELAGTHVAGRRIVDRNALLPLTEEEARLELLAGTIRPADPVGDELEAALGEPDAPPARPAKRR